LWFLALAAALLKLINYAIQVRIAGAKAPGEPVAAALRHWLAIGKHFKLTGLARRNHGVNAEPLFNHGRETRSLGFIVSSRWAGTYLNFHSVLQVVDTGFPISAIKCKSVVRFASPDYPITRDHPINRSLSPPPPIFQLLLQTKHLSNSTLGRPLRGAWVEMHPRGETVFE
jgi:hypothetical protein